MNSKTPIIDSLKKYIEKQDLRLHMPGHKGKAIMPGQNIIGSGVYKADVTEVAGLDNLHQPAEAIAQLEQLTAELFGAQHSFLLVNGATAGIHATFLSLSQPGKKALIPRNSHKAVFSALVLTGLEPVYLPIEVCPRYGMPLGIAVNQIDINKIIEEISFIFNVRPTYDGVVEPLLNQENAVQVVDEAHGGHFKFSDVLPDTALECGGDFVVQGSHKTLGSLTQTGLLHVADNKHKQQVRQALSMIQSTSPSYLLMASLDIMRYNMEVEGNKLMADCIEVAMFIRNGLKSLRHFFCVGAEDVAPRQLDYTKVAFGHEYLTGFQLAKILREEYGIQVEMATAKYVLAIITIFDDHETSRRLLGALRDISKRYKENIGNFADIISLPQTPTMAMSPRQAYFTSKKTVKLGEANGLVCGEILCLYPPGIPIICPGEIINHEVIEYIRRVQRQGIFWHGCCDPKLKTIQVATDIIDDDFIKIC